MINEKIYILASLKYLSIKKSIMRKILLLFATFLFVSFASYASEGEIEKNINKTTSEKQNVNFEKQKNAENSLKTLKKSDKKLNFFQKVRKVRKIKKELKKNQTAMGKMMMAGLGLLLGGLIIYLIGVTLVGTIIMVIGLVLLLYAVLKKFF